MQFAGLQLEQLSRALLPNFDDIFLGGAGCQHLGHFTELGVISGEQVSAQNQLKLVICYFHDPKPFCGERHLVV